MTGSDRLESHGSDTAQVSAAGIDDGCYAQPQAADVSASADEALRQLAEAVQQAINQCGEQLRAFTDKVGPILARAAEEKRAIDEFLAEHPAFAERVRRMKAVELAAAKVAGRSLHRREPAPHFKVPEPCMVELCEALWPVEQAEG